MSIEQDQALVQTSIRTPNKNIDWVNLVGATVRLKIDNEAVTDSAPNTREDDARIAFSQDTVREVLAHPKELVVFYERPQHDDGETAHFFTAVIPDHDDPFDYYYDLDTNPEKKRPLVRNLGLFLNPAEVDHGSYSVVANRQISFDDSDSNSTVWMGAGSFEEDRSPDAMFSNPAKIAAVGNVAVAQLFTELATEEANIRGKLVGAAMYLGSLALEFKVPLLTVPELAFEINDQLSILYFKEQRSQGLTSVNAHYVRIIEDACADFKRDRAQLQLGKEEGPLHGITPNHIPGVGDSRTWPYIDINDFDQETDRFTSLARILKAEKSEHERRLSIYNDYYKILTALKG